MRTHQSLFYADGSSKGNPGSGRFAWIEVDNERVIQQYTSSIYDNVTNNQMELSGVVAVAMHAHHRGTERIKIATDSSYIVNSYNVWLKNWIKNEKALKKIKNIYYWIIIYALSTCIDIEIVWVKGHSDNNYNNLVDKLCSFRDVV